MHRALIIVLLACLSASGATTRYVSTAGNDTTGTGTVGNPWLTIKKGCDSSSSGDTLLVQPGIYTEWVLIDTAGLKIMANGAVTNRGTLHVRANNVEVNGFQISTGPNDALFYGGAIRLGATVSNVLVISNYVHDLTNNAGGVFMENNGVGPLNGPQSCRVILNTVSNIYEGGIFSVCGANNLVGTNWAGYCGHDFCQLFGTNNVVQNNFATHIQGSYQGSADHVDMVQVFGDSGMMSQTNFVRNNVFYYCPESAICQLTQDNGTDIGNLTFANNLFVYVPYKGSIDIPGCNWYDNTFYACAQDVGIGGHCLQMAVFDPTVTGVNNRGAATNCVIKGNAFIDCGNAANNGWYNLVTISTTNAWANSFTTNDLWGTYTADYNYACKSDHSAKTGFSETHGVSGGDPKLIRETTNSTFRLKPMLGSVLIDAGITNVNVVADLEGVGRPQNGLHDIGAYEFDPSLKLHLDFDTSFSGGKVVDVTGNANDGWQQNSTNWIYSTNGVFGSSAGWWTINWRSDNGAGGSYPASQYIAVTNQVSITNTIKYLTNGTISFWASYNTNGSGKADQLLYYNLDTAYNVGGTASGSNCWRMGRQFVFDERIVSFNIYTSATSDSLGDSVVNFGTETTVTTSLHLYTVTFTNTGSAMTMIAYLNGAAVQTNTVAGVPWLRMYGTPYPWLNIGAGAHDSTPLWGDDRYPNDCYHDGGMDDIRIYNRQLSPAEVGSLYAGTGSAPASGPTTNSSSSTLNTTTMNVGTLRFGQ